MNRIKYKREKTMANFINIFNCIPGILIENFEIKRLDKTNKTAVIEINFKKEKNDLSLKKMTMKVEFYNGGEES